MVEGVVRGGGFGLIIVLLVAFVFPLFQAALLSLCLLR